MPPLSNNDFTAATDFAAKVKRPLLVTHARPDGDAIGSVLATRELLRGIGADPVGLFFGRIPARYTPFQGYEAVRSWEDGFSREELDACDGVIVLDTCTYNQIEPIAKWLRSCDKPVLAVDHHATRDELATHHLIDVTAAANCLILFEWAKFAGWKVSEPVARALFTGIAMDTGWFRHANTDARVFDAMGELVALGVSPSTLYDGLYHQDSEARLQLAAKALATLEVEHGARVALMRLTHADFQSCGALMSDAEDLVNEPLRIASVIASALLVEQDDGVIRVNLRSKPPEVTGGVNIDVSQVARSLGGGGHVRAAGTRLRKSLDAAAETVLEALRGGFTGV